MATEREAKYRLSDGDAERIIADCAPFLTDARTIPNDAVYYDTAARTLSGMRAALRLRREGDSTVCALKLSGTVAGGVHTRAEFECVADTVEDALPGLLKAGAPADIVDALRDATLLPIARTRFTRRAFLLAKDGVTAELCIDEGTLAGRTAELAFAELELEHVAGAEQGFYALCAWLAERFSLVPEPESKLARALKLA